MDAENLMVLTAKNARKLQQDNPAKLEQLNSILKSISIHVTDSEKIETYIMWHDTLTNITESKLKEMGYNVELLRHDGPMYRISWY